MTDDDTRSLKASLLVHLIMTAIAIAAMVLAWGWPPPLIGSGGVVCEPACNPTPTVNAVEQMLFTGVGLAVGGVLLYVSWTRQQYGESVEDHPYVDKPYHYKDYER